MCLNPPEDYRKGEPLKGNGRGIQSQTVPLARFRQAHQMPNPAQAEQRHGGGEED